MRYRIRRCRAMASPAMTKTESALGQTIERRLAEFPRTRLAHLPTPLEPLPRLGRSLGLDLSIKRDDCTGLALGGNKARQLEYYMGAAVAAGADSVLVTGAMQSNFVRATAAATARLGMTCHIQLEQRVPINAPGYRRNGNVLLDRLLGATLHQLPFGEDETAADAALEAIADQLRGQGHRPYVIHLAAAHPPLGALGYVVAASELAAQFSDAEPPGEIVIGSGSALTHVGLLFGLRWLGLDIPVRGICVRREAAAQTARVARRIDDLARLLNVTSPVRPHDIRLDDSAMAPGYGQFSAAVRHAVERTARLEGVLLDPVYSGKVMAGLFGLAERQALASARVLFWHTGGQPALFAYSDFFWQDPP